MKFRVIKSSIDGVCGGDSLLTIDEACREICFYKGWDSTEQLHAAIRKWAANAKPASIFRTAASVIVASVPDSIGDNSECPDCLSDDVEYGELDPVEGGTIEQKATCNQCGHHWMDVFALTERHTLCKS